MSAALILDETRVWFDNLEITHHLRTGREPLAVEGNQVVYAETRRPWAPPELVRRAGEHTEDCP